MSNRNPREIIGEKLKEYRESLNETQEEFATRLFINRSTLSLIEKGSQAPDLELLIKIMKLTKIDPYELLDIDYKKNVVLSEDIIFSRPQRLREDIQKQFDKVYIPDVIIASFAAYKESGTHSQREDAEWFFNTLEHRNSNGIFEILDTSGNNKSSNVEKILYATKALARANEDDMYYYLTDDYAVRTLSSSYESTNFRIINNSKYIELFRIETDYNIPLSQKFYSLLLDKKLDEAKQLLDTGVNINHVDEATGLTPLILSITRGDLATFDWLIMLNGIDVNALDDHKHRLPPISHAIRTEALSIDDKVYVVNKLIERGANVNEPSKSDLNWFNMPLMIASWHGILDIVSLLIENGACIDQQDKGNGYTPLIKAVINGHTDVVAYLLEHGANKNIYAHNTKYYMKKAIDIAYENNTNNKNSKIIDLLNRE